MELEEDRPMDLLVRRRVIGERAMISHVTLEEGFVVDAHRHENEQFACVVSGRIRFSLPEEGREVTLGAGQVLHLPSNVLHGAHALERTVVLDVFSPVSESTGIDHSG
jgi:unsaturated pyranuronate lyase